MKSFFKILKLENMLHFMASLVLTVIAINVNTTCAFIVHQSKLPECAKKLRKF